MDKARCCNACIEYIQRNVLMIANVVLQYLIARKKALVVIFW